MIKNSNRYTSFSESRGLVRLGIGKLVNGLMRAVESILRVVADGAEAVIVRSCFYGGAEWMQSINHGWHRRFFLSLSKGHFLFFGGKNDNTFRAMASRTLSHRHKIKIFKEI